MNHSYKQLLSDRGFQSFLWTQFLGALNDNVFKMITSVTAVSWAASKSDAGFYLALTGAVFVLPFLLFSGYAGQIADRFDKASVLKWTKSLEVVSMGLGIFALTSHRIEWMLAVLFLLAVQAAFFSPAKYGIVPEILPAHQISRANALLELSTFAAIVLGTSLGTWLFARWQHTPETMGYIMLALAVIGTFTSFGITLAQGRQSSEAFHWNPLHEVIAGCRRLRQSRGLAMSVAGISFFWFVAGLLQMALLLLGSESLGIGEVQVGLLVTSLAAGIGLGSLAAGSISGDSIELALVPIGGILFGTTSVALALTQNYWWALAWMALTGFFAGWFIVPLNAYLQERAGANEKGRLLAANNFLNMLGVIAASGTLWLMHDAMHLRAAKVVLVWGAVTALLGVAAIAFTFRRTLRFALVAIVKILFRVEVHGAENIPAAGAALIISNHVTYLDALLLGSLTPRFIRFLMLKSFFDHKLLRPFVTAFHAIPVQQGCRRSAIEALQHAAAELRSGELVGIFPEGALTTHGRIAEFQRGVERLMETGAPVIPIRMDGLWGHATSRRPRWAFPIRWRVTITIGPALTHQPTADELRGYVQGLGTLDAQFLANARARWNEQAIVDSTGRKLTYGEAATAAAILAAKLARTASQVGVLLPASAGGALANIAIALNRQTAVNLNFTAGDQQLTRMIEICGAKQIVTSRVFVAKAKLAARPEFVFLEDLLPQATAWQKAKAYARARWFAKPSRNPEAIAAIVFSSGSTSEPKGVMLSHRNILANLRAITERFELDSATDRILGSLPLFHSFGYTCTLWLPLIEGTPVVYHANPLEAAKIGELIAQHRCTFLLATPTFLRSYLQKCTPEQFASMRTVLVGAEALRVNLAAEFEARLGIRPLEGYGATELAPVVAVNTKAQHREGSVGQPLPGVNVTIVDPETLQPVARGAEGLILVTGANRMAGYFGKPAHTGPYNTGDIGRLSSDGFLYITGRLARFSKIAGEMVPHGKVEVAIADAFPGLRAIVVGIPDERRGERLIALYTDECIQPRDIAQALSRRGLPALWIPKSDSIFAVSELPLLGSGKLDLRRAIHMAQQEVDRAVAA